MQEEKKKMTKLQMLGNIFIALVLGAMVLMVFVNAVARYAFTANFPVFEELSRYLFVWVAFLGAMMAFKEGRHVGVDMLVNALHGKKRLIIKLVAQAAMFVCLAVMGWGGFQYFKLTATDPSPSAGIPFGMISGMAIIIVVYMLYFSIGNTKKIFDEYKAGLYEKTEGKEE